MCGSSYHICTPPKEQFEFCPKNVNFEEMQEALNEYVKYGACFSKSRVCFTHTNNILHYNYMILMILKIKLNFFLLQIGFSHLEGS
jgi:hypothetical protein